MKLIALTVIIGFLMPWCFGVLASWRLGLLIAWSLAASLILMLTGIVFVIVGKG